ncbi:hypothetical protein MAPG_01234 [Magnaporthiopsis poae ATCC 64411]|uniref:T6SS Phospholipase effector Tle1-like catalytic domain-containing protein n=1 Tax=Magnaporthiopsis poae (strain ATCC 64411 / 73-15) TaxID=644358 RepID=A0A0C4DN58_MAGP6|nr:hypothetical protein MAPG_01234 [Magnaporthiopsis poae ATCC 64411]
MAQAQKRIIVCCDGSWMDSLGSKGGLPQSNVSRISRVIKRTCHDGTHQLMLYDPGVGTGVLKMDQLTGGGFGMGLAENVRECYNFICSNYVDGDDIILVGFSRGAFTARSIADMIATIGLLTAAGLDYFYKIFEDYQNLGNSSRSASEYMWSGPAYDSRKYKAKSDWVAERKQGYRAHLKERGMTRDTFTSAPDRDITVKALAVWDTVGSLGIPPVSALGLRGSAKQWKFSGTSISHKVEYAFQALALDEPRDAFKPALWERLPENTKTKLKQVWFPGNHGGVGGGWWDQQIADITLAWMCDQLSTVGVEFNFDRMTQVLEASLAYSAAHPFPFVPNWMDVLKLPTSMASWWAGPPKAWARDPIFASVKPLPKRDTGDCNDDCKTRKHIKLDDPQEERQAALALARPWALGQTRYPSRVQSAFGHSNRHPGLFTRTDPDTNKSLNEPLVNTSERIHSSVRVRLACQGLSMDDADVWRCDALVGADGEKIQGNRKAQPLWRLERGDALDQQERQQLATFRPRELDFDEYSLAPLYNVKEKDTCFRWTYANDENIANPGEANQLPQFKVLPEEPLVGYWERYLLQMTTGKQDVWRYAEQNPGC